jgi:hypothetical protein
VRSTYIADSTNATGVNAILARAIVARSFTGKTPAKRSSPMPFLRIASLERIITDRYGKQRLPADEEGFDILRPMADHLAQIDPGRIRPWAAKWMPGLSAADVDDLVASREALIAECGKTALHWGADELAHHVDLDDAARTRTRSWTVGAVDCDKAEREERRKITRAAAARAKRAAAGATPRAQSITATKPWIKDGFSTRRTWERHGKRPRVANSRPAILLLADHLFAICGPPPDNPELGIVASSVCIGVSMAKTCIVCGGPAGSGEHIFPACLGGLRVNNGIYCGPHNNGYGDLAALLANQLAFFNASLGIRNGRTKQIKPAVLTDPATGLKVNFDGKSLKPAGPQILTQNGNSATIARSERELRSDRDLWKAGG